MSKYLIILAGAILLPLSVFAYTSPGKPQGFVSDFAHVLNATDIQSIESQLTTLQNSSGVQVAVVTVSTLGDESVEMYAVKLFEEWKIGAKGKDSGLLILVAPNDRTAKIETGYGVEGIVTDLQSGNIINKVMIPAFKTGDYASGIKGAVNALSGIITNSSDAAQFSSSDYSNSSGSKINLAPFIFFLFFFGSVLGRILGKTKSWWLGGVLGAGAGLIISLIWGFLYYGLGAIIALSIFGLIFDFFVSKGGPKDGSGHSGTFPFIMGGFGGGGFGGGSGGFGGFGGGMSGGGGASGRW